MSNTDLDADADADTVGVGGAGHRSRVLLVLSCIVSVVVLGGALAAPVIARLAGYERAPADLSDVVTYDITDRSHSEEDLDYAQVPPAGGDHAPVWLDCGVYDEPVREENAVHDLEHGTVWITYEPGLAGEEVDALADVLPQNGILSPYDDLRAPVVVTVWERQLELTGADDPRLELFIREFGAGETAPEPMASCAGGLQPDSGGTNA